MTTAFEIEIARRAGSLILVVKGELDMSTAGRLDQELTRAKATDAATIVVDLDQVGFIDSSGLQVLIEHARPPENPGRVNLTRGSPQAQRLFELTGALDRLPFV